MKLTKALLMRLVWFVVGGVASIGLNIGLFNLFHVYIGWNRFLSYALALSISGVLLFLWNYFVGFRTKRHLVGSAWRHAVSLGVAYALDYTLVVILHGMFPARHNLVIAAVKIAVAGFKFGIYHFWVYPEHPAEPAAAVGEGRGPITPIDEPLPPRAN